MLIDNISVVIMAKDSQMTIAKCLNSLKNFQEVVLYLNNSTDNTVHIASKFDNVKIIDGEFLGFGPTKNKAAQFSSNDWILSLDSDEVLSEEFVMSLNKIELDTKYIYEILRTNYYKDIQVKYCWGDDKIVRLYNKTKTSFTDKKVHESIINDGFKIQKVKGFVEHYPYASITDFIVKLDRYSTIFAQDNMGRKKSSPLKAILNAKFSFFKTYILKRGFLDGYAGLIIAFSHMATNFYKYMKLYEANKEYDNSNHKT